MPESKVRSKTRKKTKEQKRRKAADARQTRARIRDIEAMLAAADEWLPKEK